MLSNIVATMLSYMLLIDCTYAAPVCNIDYDGGPTSQTLCQGNTGTGYNGTVACEGQSVNFDLSQSVQDFDATDFFYWMQAEGLAAHNQSHADPIAPHTCPNYIRSTTGTGTLIPAPNYQDPSPNKLSLISLSYMSLGCADPLNNQAVACNVTVSATAWNQTTSGRVYPYTYSHTYQYSPPTKVNATMLSVNFEPIIVQHMVRGPGYSILPHHGTSYKFKAVKPCGNPATLYIDNLSYNWWYSRG